MKTPQTPSPNRGNKSLFIVLGALALFAVVAGAQGFRMFIRSETFIRVALAEITAQGASLEYEGCVDATMAQAAKCDAMKSLCDASVPRLMEACLSGRDRKAECGALGRKPENTHFGYAECQARGVDRWNRKTCASAYRAIDHFCAPFRADGSERLIAPGQP